MSWHRLSAEKTTFRKPSFIRVSCQSSSLLLLLEVCKNHYKRENISDDGSEQREDALFEFMPDRLD